jgi:hypothetical protein
MYDDPVKDLRWLVFFQSLASMLLLQVLLLMVCGKVVLGIAILCIAVGHVILAGAHYKAIRSALAKTAVIGAERP